MEELRSHYSTISGLGLWQDEKPNMVIINAEWNGYPYRARLYPDVNPVKVQTYLDADNNPIKLVTVSGYKMDRFGARLGRDNLIQLDDHNKVDVDNVGELFARCCGDRTLQWFLPAEWNVEISYIDWVHPTFIG